VSGDISNVRDICNARQIIPRLTSDISTSLGTSSNIWQRAFINTINATTINTTTINTTNINGSTYSPITLSEVTSSIIPATTYNSLVLGVYQNRWNEAFINNVNAINIIPTIADIGTIGRSDNKWNTAFINTIDATTIKPPSTGSGSLGITGTRWNQGFINNITAINITPTSDGGGSLGITGTKWNQGFINNITATNITTTSITGGSLGITGTRWNQGFINNITATDISTTNISVTTSISIPDNSIDGSKITTGTITSTQIADGTIVDGDISTTANIDGSKISGNIAGSKINTNTISADKINLADTFTFKYLNVNPPSGTNYNIYEKLQELLHFIIPEGTVIAWHPSGVYLTGGNWNNTIPAGWSLCDGANGRPDLRGRFILGAGTGAGTDSDGESFTPRVWKATGGSQNHRLNLQQIPSHTHTYSYADFADVYNNQFGNNTRFCKDGYMNYGGITSATGGINATTTERHNNMPPFYVLVYIIKDTYSPAPSITSFTASPTSIMQFSSASVSLTPVFTGGTGNISDSTNAPNTIVYSGLSYPFTPSDDPQNPTTYTLTVTSNSNTIVQATVTITVNKG
jgi:hypothetical protein